MLWALSLCQRPTGDGRQRGRFPAGGEATPLLCAGIGPESWRHTMTAVTAITVVYRSSCGESASGKTGLLYITT